jgi:hypothetical protein
MAIELVWETKNVARLNFTGHWSWADLKSAIAQIEVDYPYDAILNFNDNITIPRDLLSIVHQLAPDNLRYLILVSNNNPFVQTIAEIFAGLNKGFAQKYRLASTVDEAHNISSVGQPLTLHQEIAYIA